MDGRPALPGADDENVVVTSGDVTSISAAGTAADPVATGGSAIAASLSPEGDVLNIAFVTGGGDVQIVQIRVADLMQGDAIASGDVVLQAELTQLSGDVIREGSGAATPVGTVAVAATLGEDGDLNLSFADGNGDMQMIEANVAEVLRGVDAAAGGSTPAP